MRVRTWVFSTLLFAVMLGISAPTRAQKPCAPPPVPAPRGNNIFNAQQEMDLGEVQAEWLQRQFRVVDDPDVTGYMQRVADRLVQRMPAGSVKFKFVVFDLPIVNAFGISGGRIYVSRKMVGFLHSEDELAGLLGHELGHLAAHHAAIDWSEIFQKAINANSVSDRRDIFDKVNQFLDTAARKPAAFKNLHKWEDRDQLVADHLGLYLTSAAGYDPLAMIKFWDRFAETKGKTGGFISDMFGASKPEEKRLRDLEKEVPTLPGACGDQRPAATQADFTAWQAAVLNYSGLGHRESLHGVLFKRELDPPLRGDIRHLRFSPDGKYILAQDDSSLYILTREPFAPLFRIDAPEANSAMFSADSQTVSFYTSGLRVETWNIADQERTGLHDMALQHSCIQTQLSPDGKFLACYASETFALRIYDVSTSQQVFEKKEFYQPRSFMEYFLLFLDVVSDDIHNRVVTMRFSPDSHYFVACTHDDTTDAIDLTTMKPILLPGSLKRLMTYEFVFMGPDRIAGVNINNPEKSAIMKFPTGEMVEELAMGTQNIAAPTRGNYLLLRPVKNFPLGVLNLETKKIFITSKEPSFDIYDAVAVVQRIDGEIALKTVTDNLQIAKVQLPRGPLAPLRAMALSPDLKWLAVSEKSRGGVWDLINNQRVFYVRGFGGAFFGADGAVYADFPKFEETGRQIGKLDLANRVATQGVKLEESAVRQRGPFLVITTSNKKNGILNRDVTEEVRETVSGKSLWSRTFPHEAPRVYVEPDTGTFALEWSLTSASAKAEMESNTDLAKKTQSVRREDTNLLVEVLDGKTGKYQGGVAVDTNKNSFRISDIFAAGNTLVISDSQNRILTYSLSTGEQIGKTFGRAAEVSTASGLIAAENELGQLLLLSLSSLEKRDELIFNSPIAMKHFSDDGKRLFVLTAAQTAYVLDVSALAGSSTTKAAAN
jgi:hypothetical protein